MKINRLVFSPIDVNTYILADDSDNCAIIDCGCYDISEFDKLVRVIESRKLNPVLLLNTHCHLDHIFGNGFMLEKYNLKTLSGREDEINRIKAVKHAALFGLFMNEPPEPGGFIADRQVINFGSTELIALNVPGHSPGSIAFYCEKDGCVFTGDALFAGSIGRTDLEGGDYDTLINSIQSRLFVLPPSTVVYPGHGSQTTIEKERMTNPFFS
jgi:glyoxylase-like metal-dependent hydrolase (beta-lactamase superfamily II)